MKLYCWCVLSGKLFVLTSWTLKEMQLSFQVQNTVWFKIKSMIFMFPYLSNSSWNKKKSCKVQRTCLKKIMEVEIKGKSRRVG